jgi:hypothetical protein
LKKLKKTVNNRNAIGQLHSMIRKTFLFIMSGSVLLHRQRSPEDLQQLLAWYKIRDTLFGENNVERDIKEALGLASVCEYPNAVWLTKLFDGRDVSSTEEARQVFLGCENDSRALCFAGILGWHGKLLVRSLFDGRKNLLLKENEMVSTSLDNAIDVELDARKMRKEQKITFGWGPLRDGSFCRVT